MKPDEMMGMTGMPMGKKRTRRGKRKGKGGQHAEHMQHLAEMKRCAECQDHKGARNAAFRFIKSMPADEMEMETPVVAQKTDVPRSTKKLSPGLAAFFKKKGK